MARFTLERDPDGRISGARSINPENHTPMSDILPPPGSTAPAEGAPEAKRTWYQERSTLIASALALALLLLVITFLSDSRGAAEAPPGSALPTASVVGDVLRVRSASAAPAATPAPPAGWSTLERSVNAYDQPAGRILGALEQGRAYRVIGRYGSEWLLIEAASSGGVTIRAAEAGIAIDQALADYAPPPAPAYQAPPGGAPEAPPAPRVLPLPETPIVLINALAAPPGAQYDSHCGGSNPPLVCAPGDTPGGAEDIAAGVGASAAPTPQP